MSRRGQTGAAASGIHYPSSDGKPLAETDWHVRALLGLLALLDWYFRDESDVYVAGNNFLYYEEGNPRAAISPDVYVVRGVPKGLRRIFKLWEEGAPPTAVFEMSSRKTRREDLGSKMDRYARLGVAEYYLFDPEHDYLDPPLQGYCLAGDRYAARMPETDGRLVSEALGLRFGVDGEHVAVYDLATDQRVLPADLRALQAEGRAESAEERALQVEERVVLAEAKAIAAEAENEKLREELARLKG